MIPFLKNKMGSWRIDYVIPIPPSDLTRKFQPVYELVNSISKKCTLNVKFDHDLEISFNSRYLIDVASQLDGERVEIFFNDTGSPALIKDPGDFDSIFIVMPMKG